MPRSVSCVRTQNYPAPRRLSNPTWSQGGKGLVPDVLQEPFGRDLAARPSAPGGFVHLAGDRIELRTLEVAALRIGELVGRGAAFDLAGNEVGERDAPVRQRVAVLAAAPAAIAVLSLGGSRLVTDVLGVGAKLGVSDRRRRIAEAQIDVDPGEARRVGLAGAAHHDNVRALLEQAA